MLKSCWDCIAGYNANREQAENDGPYGIRLNGDTQRQPPWPQPRYTDEIMFLLPRPLNSGDKIEVSGQMRNDPKSFRVNLITGNSAPDYDNIACQLEARFPSSSDDKIVLKIIQNGYAEEIGGDYQSIPATQWFTETNFNFGFSISLGGSYSDGHSIEISIGPSFLQEIKLKHDIKEIRYLTIQGDVEKVDKLDFNFV